ncbi:uncharacterized protein LOC123542500 isoform X3 [Mercenaria mercenaria]|uniref:uncharacterized protein LOC123542500 isoform X3 n=1 Tax=Mercenaria mercenaria TaxID=6596 RepID=UPI00234E8CE9|nr:uncharacterized protein LOC123542500 isoform X3 [Mercenaria mercenaria]
MCQKHRKNTRVEAIHSGRYCILIGGTSVYILSYSSKYSYNMPPRKRQKTAKAAAAEEAAKTKRGPKPVEQVTEAITSNLSDKDLNTIISNVVPAVTQGVLQVLKDLKVIPPENPQNQNFEEEQLPLPTQSSSASVPTPLLAASGTNPNSATFLRPLFLGIDEKIKSKIVADQFVELDSILDKDRRFSGNVQISTTQAPACNKRQFHHLVGLVSHLVHSALSPSTHTVYQRAFDVYQEFLAQTFNSQYGVPVDRDHLLLFIAFCFNKQLAASTVSTYISALGNFMKLKNLPDVTQLFLVKKALQGYHNLVPKTDTRLPITNEILHNLIRSLDAVCNSQFLRILLTAMYLLAFHAFLRVGEFTSSSPESYIIGVEHVTFNRFHGELNSFDLVLKNYKYSRGKTHKLHIPCCHHELNMCPVHALYSYYTLRNPPPGPLFSFFDNSQVTRSFFCTKLQMSLTWAGYSTDFYKGHSFRIGAASQAAFSGVPEEKIRLMGRWSSNAFKKYIRIPMGEQSNGTKASAK